MRQAEPCPVFCLTREELLSCCRCAFTQQLTGSSHERVERRGDDIFTDGDTTVPLPFASNLNIGHCLGIGALTQRVLTILHDFKIKLNGILERFNKRIEHTITLTVIAIISPI